MKFFIAFALTAVASAAYIKPTQESAGVADIVDPIQSQNPDPATAAAPELETNPISVGPTLIAFPISDGGAVTAEEHPVIPAADSSPLVQIFIVSVGTNAANCPIKFRRDGTGHVAKEANVTGPVIVPGPAVSPIQVAEPIVPPP